MEVKKKERAFFPEYCGSKEAVMDLPWSQDVDMNGAA